MKLKTKLFRTSAIVGLFTFIGCGSVTGPKNELPVITSLTANPDKVMAGGTSTLTCVANDSDGDSLIYTWEATSGLIRGRGSTVTWTAPTSDGTFSVSCRVDDGNDGDDTETVSLLVEVPLPGQWSGDNTSFTVSENSTSVKDFLCSYSGHASGTYCSFNYETTVKISSSITIEDNSFSLNFGFFALSGTFIDPENAEVEVSWSGYNSYCNASYSGKRTYTASHQPSMQSLAKVFSFNNDPEEDTFVFTEGDLTMITKKKFEAEN